MYFLAARRVDTSGFDNSMSEDQIHNWLTRQLNRSPELADFYYVGQTMFQAGAYGGAVRLLSLNVANGRGDLPAHHLLGHSLAIINERERAVSFLKNCVNKGFDDDWQLLIELQVELDTASQINYGPSNGDIVPSRASKTSLPSFSPSFNLPSSTPHKLPSQEQKKNKSQPNSGSSQTI